MKYYWEFISFAHKPIYLYSHMTF
uniref:Uncharacterized protein n=1 Tax=Rhizophora mucronata TaxID=61149 RepID=A0A2P2PYW9_RHIMU